MTWTDDEVHAFIAEAEEIMEAKWLAWERARLRERDGGTVMNIGILRHPE